MVPGPQPEHEARRQREARRTWGLGLEPSDAGPGEPQGERQLQGVDLGPDRLEPDRAAGAKRQGHRGGGQAPYPGGALGRSVRQHGQIADPYDGPRRADRADQGDSEPEWTERQQARRVPEDHVERVAGRVGDAQGGAGRGQLAGVEPERAGGGCQDVRGQRDQEERSANDAVAPYLRHAAGPLASRSRRQIPLCPPLSAT